jgi:hypothetical protein
MSQEQKEGNERIYNKEEVREIIEEDRELLDELAK